jgi:hypothetical protein
MAQDSVWLPEGRGKVRRVLLTPGRGVLFFLTLAKWCTCCCYFMKEKEEKAGLWLGESRHSCRLQQGSKHVYRRTCGVSHFHQPPACLRVSYSASLGSCCRSV